MGFQGCVRIARKGDRPLLIKFDQHHWALDPVVDRCLNTVLADPAKAGGLEMGAHLLDALD